MGLRVFRVASVVRRVSRAFLLVSREHAVRRSPRRASRALRSLWQQAACAGGPAPLPELPQCLFIFVFILLHTILRAREPQGGVREAHEAVVVFQRSNRTFIRAYLFLPDQDSENHTYVCTHIFERPSCNTYAPLKD